MKIKILSSKPNMDGTIALKLDKGADRIELIRLEGLILDLDREKATVQSPSEVMAKNIMHKFDELRDEIRAWVEGTGEIITPVTKSELSDAAKYMNEVES